MELEIPKRFNAATSFVDKHLAEGRGGRTALLCEGRSWTYAEIYALVNRCGNGLRELGVEMEDRVLLALLDSPEFAGAFFGAIKIGAVPVPVNTLVKAAEYAHFLRDSRARVLLVHESLLEEISPALQGQKYLRHVVVVGEPGPGQIRFRDWAAAASPELEPADTHKDDVAFWLYSSGSTGMPKAVVHLQHDMLVASELYARGVLGIAESDRTFSVAKLFFAYGLGNGLYFPFHVGASTILLPGKPTPPKIFEVLETHRPTLFFAVPTVYVALLQEAAQALTPTIRACVSAGEALPGELYRLWKERFGVEILDGIGSTEMLHIFISNRLGAVRPGSSGQLVPSYEARIVDEGGNPVPVGEVGNLLVKGDSAAAYYWNNHEKTKSTMQGEWVVTGDKYYCDREGYYWYCGRSDDMLKVKGMWVSPVEIESTFVAHPAVLESAVIGLQDEMGLTKPKAYVVVKKGHAPGPSLADELLQHARKALPDFKCPAWVEFVDDLPKTATGKIRRFKLREQETLKVQMSPSRKVER